MDQHATFIIGIGGIAATWLIGHSMYCLSRQIDKLNEVILDIKYQLEADDYSRCFICGLEYDEETCPECEME